MKRVVLSKHAYERLLQMDLDLDTVREVVRNPEWTDHEGNIRRAFGKNIVVVLATEHPAEDHILTILPRTRERYVRPDVV